MLYRFALLLVLLMPAAAVAQDDPDGGLRVESETGAIVSDSLALAVHRAAIDTQSTTLLDPQRVVQRQPNVSYPLPGNWQTGSLAKRHPFHLGNGNPDSRRKVFARAHQQAIEFRVSGSVLSAQVRLQGDSHWQTLRMEGNAWARRAVWDNPPEATSATNPTRDFELRVQVVTTSTFWATYDMELVTIPSAHAVYQDGIGNTVTHWKGGSNPIDKPFFIVEGIDGANKNFEESYYALAFELATKVRQQGGDLYIFNFADGGISLLENGVFLEASLNYFTNQTASADEFVLVGVSMGGVVAKLTLAAMEGRNRTHNVDTFVSMDAPHQSAIIDDQLLDYVDFWDWAVSPPINLTSEAALELLEFNNYSDNYPSWHSSMFRSQISTFNGTGYPSDPLLVGVSFGNSTNLTGVTLPWLTHDRPFPVPDKKFYLNYPENQPGSILPLETTDISNSYRRSGSPTFIRLSSALDVTGGQSRFDITLDASSRSYHDVIPPNVTDELLQVLGYTAPGPSVVRVSGPSCLIAGHTGTFTASPIGGIAPYRYSWQFLAPSCGPGERGPSCGEWAGDWPNRTYPFRSLTPGTYQVRVNVKDDNNNQRMSPSVSVRVVANDRPDACGRSLGDFRVVSADVNDALERDLTVPGSILVGTDAALTPDPVAIAPTAPKTGDADLRVEGVYPNPTAGLATLRIESAVEETARVEVYDMLGRMTLESREVLLDAGMDQISLDLSDVAPGAYVVRVQTSRTTVQHPITVTR